MLINLAKSAILTKKEKSFVSSSTTVSENYQLVINPIGWLNQNLVGQIKIYCLIVGYLWET